MPVGLHRELAYAAKAEGVSMNQFICTVLAGAVGWSSHVREQKQSRERRRGDEAVSEMWRKLLS